MLTSQCIDENGWVVGVTWCPSPNFDMRPTDKQVDMLVVHNISLPPGEFGGHYIEDLFLNRLDPDAHPFFLDIYRCQVSSHFLIRRNGEIVQFVSVCDKAWHAGRSEWQGVPNCNDYSLGIELEGSDFKPFTSAQYFKLSELVKLLISFYPMITLERVVGHSDIAPERKTDPGPCFDWERFKNGVRSISIGHTEK